MVECQWVSGLLSGRRPITTAMSEYCELIAFYPQGFAFTDGALCTQVPLSVLLRVLYDFIIAENHPQTSHQIAPHQKPYKDGF